MAYVGWQFARACFCARRDQRHARFLLSREFRFGSLPEPQWRAQFFAFFTGAEPLKKESFRVGGEQDFCRSARLEGFLVSAGGFRPGERFAHLRAQRAVVLTGYWFGLDICL